MRTPLPISFDPTPDAGLTTLPARPGVVVFESGDATVQVAACGDMRAFVRRRLSPEAGPGLDLGSITSRVLAVPVGSAYEADLVCLELARERLPQTYSSMTDRWRAWFIHLDAAAPTPVWTKTDLQERVGELDVTSLLGPMPDKHAAARFGELLDDLFSLCRYPAELARAPQGRSCAYKEMGKCPAACDGSEPMDAYRRRVVEAIEFAAAPWAAAIGKVEAQIEAAAAGLDFETARRLAESRTAIDKASKTRALRLVGRLDRLLVLGVLPAERFGWARLIVQAVGEVEVVADVSAEASEADLVEIISALPRAVPQPKGPLTKAGAERIGLLVNHVFRPVPRGRRRRAEWFDLSAREGAVGLDPAELARAIGAAAVAGDDKDEPDLTERSVER